jgi:hypothetical protein
MRSNQRFNRPRKQRRFAPLNKIGLTSHICHGNWVCAILDEGGSHHRGGITRRETSLIM